MAAPTAKPAPSLMDRVLSLGQAVKLASGRSPQAAVNQARQVVQQVDRRLAFTGDATVIALAGATGSGKSSLFNALCGHPYARTGVTRPTTDKAMAATWGTQAPSELLEWLRVPENHLITAQDSRLGGLTLLDLPDHDSTQDDHRVEVDRLVGLVDGLVWVLDPQKYADQVVHERYLRPYARYADVMIIVLNHADTLSPGQLQVAMTDLRRLLREDGLGQVAVLATSALTGEGLDALRSHLAQLVKDKHLAAVRLDHDVTQAASGLAGELSRNRARQVSADKVRQLDAALGAAAGVPEVTQAVLQATRLRGSAATGWPLVSWISHVRPDPLRLLHLDRLAGSKGRIPDDAPEAMTASRTSLRLNSGPRRARVDSALRALSDDVSGGLPLGWAQAVRQASLAQADQLSEELDRAVATTDLDVQRPRPWWMVVRVLQWLLIAVALVGLVWLASAPLLRFFQLPAFPSVRWHGVVVPTALLVGALVAGIVLGLLARLGVEASARRQAARAQARLTTAIDGVAQTCVVQPVTAELERYSAFVAALARAL